MRLAQRVAVAAAVLAAILGAAALGAITSLDRLLTDSRFTLTSRPTSGQIIFADIDAASLAEIGVWPWPRDIHARLLDRLMADGAAEVAFDIDFSTRSTPVADAAFAEALEAAGGYALLAAFEQLDGASGVGHLNQPIPEFSAHADPVAVNVVAGPDGRIESVPAEIQGIAALPVVLSGATPRGQDINIDFGIDLRTIERISVADLLAGRVDAARLADRQVVVGASAIELRDIFTVPRFGMLAGPLVQIAAVETLRANRALTPLGQWPGIALALVAGLGWALLGRELRIWPSLALAGGAIALVELVALAMQAGFGITAQTGGFIVSVLGLVGVHIASGFALEFARRRRAEAQLVHLARHDPVTDLPSRLGLLERMRNQPPGPILLVALTRLELVRGTLGRAVAEATLRQAAKRLVGLEAGLLGLIDRDVFALALPAGTTDEDLDRIGYAVRRVVRPRFAIEGHEVHVDSVLAASLAEPETAAEMRLQRAELALESARARSAGGITSFEPSMESSVARRRQVDAALRQAIDKGELTVVFQPQVQLDDSRLVGVEALVRWTSPELGAVSPAEFIPLAEETGLIVPLGRFVLAAACREAIAWPWPGRLAVNVSATQLKLSDVATMVEDALKSTGFPASRLDIEITESVMVDGAERLEQTLAALRRLGVGVAIDDFGTGYSSLSYLSQLSFDKLKVDQSFVRRMTASPAEEAIVRTVVELAQRLGKTTVAEGIETPEQAERLLAMGCDIGQGWLFGKPMPAGDIAARIEATRAADEAARAASA
jgi:EAL domain-containing protein (putative c-di-GMP-specific phosphodiesterase class I)/CHASE2 domain-containing sensor protein/GGDEF domain-containing protein